MTLDQRTTLSASSSNFLMLMIIIIDAYNGGASIKQVMERWS